MSELNPKNLKYIFSEKGEDLIPAIIQDSDSKKVLCLFYMNEEALMKSLRLKKVWRYSRRQERLMMKGARSGHIMEIVEIVPDCTSQSVLVKVKTEGPACLTGKESCYDL
jgi:phosphoribosyl-ATP pyrophosphohydrolase/phosphoribosyl-AMP cyclohydrolase